MKCINCIKTCCIYILDSYDWKSVADNMGITAKELKRRFPNRGKNGYCTFFKDKRCSIYEFRPFVCRDYVCKEYEKE